MFIIIPPDYEAKGVVPIAISDQDDEGRKVISGWIEAVRPIEHPLRQMTRRITGDVRNVSQVTETAVHTLSANHKEDLGPSPSRGVYVTATFAARNLKWGGQRSRRRLDVELRDLVRDSLAESSNFANEIENRDLVERLFARAKEIGREDLMLMINLYLGEEEDQIASAFGVCPNSRERNTLSQRLYRGIRGLLHSL